jgi:hypothetical protein
MLMKKASSSVRKLYFIILFLESIFHQPFAMIFNYHSLQTYDNCLASIGYFNIIVNNIKE